MFQRIRRSFRRKKASYCINCGHVSKECYHQEYENVDFSQNSQTNRDHHDSVNLNAPNDIPNNLRGPKTASDQLKWLDLDYRMVLRNNVRNCSDVQRELQYQQLHFNGQRRPQSSIIYSNEYVELPIVSASANQRQLHQQQNVPQPYGYIDIQVKIITVLLR